MVHMPHNTDYRRSFHQGAFILLVLLQQFLDHIDFDLPLTENIIFHGNILRILIGDLLIYGHDLPFQEKLFHNNGGLKLHFVCQILDGDHLRKNDYLDSLLCNLFLLLFRPDKASGSVL